MFIKLETSWTRANLWELILGDLGAEEKGGIGQGQIIIVSFHVKAISDKSMNEHE